MLRDGDPSHALTPKANKAKRNRIAYRFQSVFMHASRRFPRLGIQRAAAWRWRGRPVAFDRAGHSQIRPKRSGNCKPPAGARRKTAHPWRRCAARAARSSDVERFHGSSLSLGHASIDPPPRGTIPATFSQLSSGPTRQ